MKRPLSSLLVKRTPGAGSVEFALGAATFLLMTFAIIEMAMVVYSYNAISHAARECVRYAIVHSPTGPSPATTSQIQAITVGYADLPSPNQLAPGAVTVTWPTDPNLPSQEDAQCSISISYTLRIPFLPITTLPLSATSRMLVSQ
ncbi:MAG: TadE/TadG family type IV pilus assembly protein [Gammaproteobacteria bacterium]